MCQKMTSARVHQHEQRINAKMNVESELFLAILAVFAMLIFMTALKVAFIASDVRKIQAQIRSSATAGVP